MNVHFAAIDMPVLVGIMVLGLMARFGRSWRR
jgi:hypothetical protein